MNVITDSFYGTKLGLPCFLLFSSRSDRLAPYCFFTFWLVPTTTLLVSTTTSLHSGLVRPRSIGACLCENGIALSPSSFWGLPTERDRSLWLSAPPGFSIGGPGNPCTDCAGTSQVVAALFDFCVFLFVWMNVPWVFLTLPACS